MTSSLNRSNRFRPGVECLESREVLTNITDLTALAAQFGRHAGPTTLYVNFDGSWSRQIDSFQSADRERDIHDILLRTAQIFAPFDVQVRRLRGDGAHDQGSVGNTTVFVGDNRTLNKSAPDPDGVIRTTNPADARVFPGSADYPSLATGFMRPPNINPFDLAYVDPMYNVAYGTTLYRLDNLWISQAIAHEAGHTFGLAHVRTLGTDPAPIQWNAPGTTPEAMSYDSTNQRFRNLTFPFTSINSVPGGGTTTDPTLQPAWYFTVNWNGTILYLPYLLSTQNSYTYLQTRLGTRTRFGDSIGDVAGDVTGIFNNLSPVDPGFAVGSRPTVALGSEYLSALEYRGDHDVYRVTSSSSLFLNVRVERTTGSTLDPVVLVYDGTGQQLLGFNDDRVSGDLNSSVVFGAAANLTYWVVVGSFGSNSTGGYRVKVAPAQVAVPSSYSWSPTTVQVMPLVTTSAGSFPQALPGAPVSESVPGAEALVMTLSKQPPARGFGGQSVIVRRRETTSPVWSPRAGARALPTSPADAGRPDLFGAAGEWAPSEVIDAVFMDMLRKTRRR